MNNDGTPFIENSPASILAKTLQDNRKINKSIFTPDPIHSTLYTRPYTLYLKTKIYYRDRSNINVSPFRRRRQKLNKSILRPDPQRDPQRPPAGLELLDQRWDSASTKTLHHVHSKQTAEATSASLAALLSAAAHGEKRFISSVLVACPRQRVAALRFLSTNPIHLGFAPTLSPSDFPLHAGRKELSFPPR